MNAIVRNKRNKIIELCKSLKVKSLYLFGSATKDNFKESSDLDFLISFQDNISNEEYANSYFDLHHQLQQLFNRKIDLVTERTLSNPYLIESINESKLLLYES